MKTTKRTSIQGFFYKGILVILFTVFMGFQTFAHCASSYDGPVIKEALVALETNNVNLVLKWVYPEQEAEIISLFTKTVKLKN